MNSTLDSRLPTPEWAVGILTAPRPTETLCRTMASLVDAGWDRAAIFAEPGSALPAVDPDYWEIIQRPEQLGAWRNWIEGLRHLVDSRPDAEFCLMVQDDVVFARNVRQYIDQSWPRGKGPTAIVSPYRPGAYKRAMKPGWQRTCQGWCLVGALCWAIPRRSAEAILRDLGNVEATHRIDARVGQWAARADRHVWYHAPSLAQHTGNANSALGDTLVGDLRQAGDFVGEQADATVFLTK